VYQPIRRLSRFVVKSGPRRSASSGSASKAEIAWRHKAPTLTLSEDVTIRRIETSLSYKPKVRLAEIQSACAHTPPDLRRPGYERPRSTFAAATHA
jgi:hypothetical protein